ncbi:LysR family transcriptional regulator [Sandaracinus amylolyticus]|uniref:Chromosome initiation inhibitor n=1 Tax=Sandaracinus amylolyticus TaxID=927083 RepID=A0A0F6W8V6_9BACT|nr:LysR family transcriptional regulator [Sandaracinus amylolyticus]AKF10321.1 Chromosome initiation inhibitor [Sandaracinus amylolyticus]
MDWGDLAFFLAVTRTGSLGAAAKRLGVATTTVSRRIDALEASLGLPLLERRPDGVRATAHGARIVALAEPIEAQAAELERAALTLREGGIARVRVSATETVIADLLAPRLPRLIERAPDVRVELRSSAALVSLARHEADLAIRMSRPTDSALIAKRLPALRLGLWASAGYLGRRAPDAIDLACERLLGYDEGYGLIPEVRWFRESGLDDALVMRTTSTRALLASAVAGAGIALLPEALARPAGLIEVPSPRGLVPRSPWLLVHRDLARVPAVRAVSAWIVESIEHAVRGGRPPRPANGPDRRFRARPGG